MHPTSRAPSPNADGLFSEPQKDLYTAVLNVLKSCTALATESQCYTLADLHRRSVDFLRQELKQIGFPAHRGSLERVLYPHYIGHWLGIDLHDCASVERTTKLEDGVVVTIEPGVYVPFDDAFPKHFQGKGLGSRNIAVQEEANVVLSSAAPKEVADVERLVKGSWIDSTAGTSGSRSHFVASHSSLHASHCLFHNLVCFVRHRVFVFPC